MNRNGDCKMGEKPLVCDQTNGRARGEGLRILWNKTASECAGVYVQFACARHLV